MSTTLTAHDSLERLATAAISNNSFPTHFNIVLKLKNAMGDMQAPLKKIVSVLTGEPVISGKIVQAANAAANSPVTPITTVENAIMRIGQSGVRRIALATVMTQLTQARQLLPFSSISREIWLHSIYTSAAAWVIAKDLSPRTTPDEAAFCGLSLNLGAFYLLYRASEIEELHDAQDDVLSTLRRHTERLTSVLLTNLDMPEEIHDACMISLLEGIYLESPPKKLREIIYAAALFADEAHQWRNTETPVKKALAKPYAELKEKIEERYTVIRTEYL